MPIEFFQVTAAYSNAMLVAVMPHFSDIAKKLDLPTPQPVTQAQVRRFNCFPRSDHIGGRVILTNGCEFIFDHGRVENFVSAHSYFYLQDPDLVPTFYGPVRISEAQALQIAHNAIKKLGYTDAMLSADTPPRVTLPEKDGTNYIARYRIRWYDPTRGGNPNNPFKSAEFEVDATTGQIQMVNFFNPNTYQPDLKLNIHPPVVGQIGQGSQGTPIGPGRKMYPVSHAYSNAFLSAILPQCSQYIRIIGSSVRVPITINDVEKASYECGLVDGDPMASFNLKSGARFVYRHGQVIAFYASDVMHNPNQNPSYSYPGIDQEQAKFFGPINMTTNEAVALVRQTIRKLGYSEKMLHVDEPPRIYGPGWWGTNRIARCFMVWSESVDPPTWVNAEVDVAKKTLKALYINDHAITNIWRTPPKIDLPPEPAK
jgi:hypothetical protein